MSYGQGGGSELISLFHHHNIMYYTTSQETTGDRTNPMSVRILVWNDSEGCLEGNGSLFI